MSQAIVSRLVKLFIVIPLFTACASQGNYGSAAAKPTNYAEYKEWRKQNDPEGQLYAEYKEWEAAYRLWKQQAEVKQ